MAQKKNPNLRLMKPLNLEEMKKKAGQYRRSPGIDANQYSNARAV